MKKKKEVINIQEEFKDLHEKKSPLVVNVELDVYTGPLDALYKLVLKHKIEILEVPLLEITEQFVAFTKNHPTMELSGEFLELTTRLIYLKSAKILRQKVESDKMLKLQQEEEDIARQLLERLGVFKKYKEASLNIANLMSPTIKSYSRNKPEIITHEVFDLSSLTKENLYKAILELASLEISKELNEQIAAMNDGKLKKIYKDKYMTVEFKVSRIEKLLEDTQTLHFKDIVKNDNKIDKIVTFLALLEMSKSKAIELHQEKAFDDLIIEKNNTPNLE